MEKTCNQHYLTFLANRALQYYQQNEGRINTPQDEFKIDDYPIFSSASEFVKIEFNSSGQ